MNNASHSGYRRKIIEYIRQQARPVEKFSHQPRLYQLARQLGVDQPYDDDVLFAAAWMHDIGVFIGHRPTNPLELAAWDHIAYAFSVVPALLYQFGFPESKIQSVLEAIRTHLPKSEPVTREGILLHDADILEQLGAIAILRTVCKIGRDTRFNAFSDALHVLQKSLEELPACLKLPPARLLAEPRINQLQSFLDAVRSEAGGIEL